MATEDNRLKSLQTKHASLEEAIKQESSRPSPDAGKLQELKRQKLKLKEEIEATKK